MKKVLVLVPLLIIITGILFYGCQKSIDPVSVDSSMDKPINGLHVFTEIPNVFCTTDRMELWAGVGNESSGTLVGYVTFFQSPDKVVIDLTDADGIPGPDPFPWVISDIHIHFASTPDGIPHNNSGAPVPGQFEYSLAFATPYDSYEEVAITNGFKQYGAIHLAVKKNGIMDLNSLLPICDASLYLSGSGHFPGDPSFFPNMQISNAGFLSGNYSGWCIDMDNSILFNQNYQVCLFSSYETLPSWLLGEEGIEHPENLDKVNYLLNNFTVGQSIQHKTEMTCEGLGESSQITYGDIQMAIWKLLDVNYGGGSCWPYNLNRVYAILCDVNENGEGFVPGCGQKMAFIIVPEGTTINTIGAQIVLAMYPVECDSETAWGDGKVGANFVSNRWGTFFELCDLLW